MLRRIIGLSLIIVRVLLGIVGVVDRRLLILIVISLDVVIISIGFVGIRIVTKGAEGEV